MSDKLVKFTLSHNEEKDSWNLTNDQTDKVVKRFEYKQDATKGGVLSNTIGKEGGSVKLKQWITTIRRNVHFQEVLILKNQKVNFL